MPRSHRVLEQDVEIDASVHLERVDLHRPPERRHRLHDAAFREMKSTHIADRIGVTRVDLERAHEGAKRLLAIPEPHQHATELVVELAIVGLAGNSLAQAIHRGHLVAGPEKNPSKLVQSARMLRFAREQRSDQPLGLTGLATLDAGSRLSQDGLGPDRLEDAGRLGEAIGIFGHARGPGSISSTGLWPPFGPRSGAEPSFPALQVLAERDDDLVAAIDNDGGTGPRKVRTKGNLHNRNGEQRTEKHDHRSHVIPRQVDVPGEATSGMMDIKFPSSMPYKNVI